MARLLESTPATPEPTNADTWIQPQDGFDVSIYLKKQLLNPGELGGLALAEQHVLSNQVRLSWVWCWGSINGDFCTAAEAPSGHLNSGIQTTIRFRLLYWR